MPKTEQIKALSALIGIATIPNKFKPKRIIQPITALIIIPQKPFFLIFNSQHENAIIAKPKMIEVIISRTNTNISLYYIWPVQKLE